MVLSRILLLASMAIIGTALTGCAGSGDSATGNTLATLAGSGDSGATDGDAATARFHNPVNVASDSTGVVYVCDFDNDLIRKVATNSMVSTLVNQPDFSRPFGIAVGPGNSLYVQTDANDLGERNSTTGTVWSVNTTTGVATVVARNLGRPRGIAVLPGGDLVLSDIVHHVISRLNVSTGAVTLIAGGMDTPGFKNATGTAARFNRPYGVTVLVDGSILVADQNNNRIRRVTQSGVVSTYAGSGTAGSVDGTFTAGCLNGPQDVKVAPGGQIYVADTSGHQVRLLTNGYISTFAGTGVRGFADGPRLQSQFWGLEGIAVKKSGEVVVADGTGGDDDDPAYNRVRVIQQ